ncbi:Ribonuclease H-like domain protein [Raphanus sativus]|nr:Ribonuclease H-like domain protein [Raphanus sativus]
MSQLSSLRSLPFLFVSRFLSVSLFVSVSPFLSVSVSLCPALIISVHLRPSMMDNEDTMNLNDTDYMSGDELDQSSNGDENEAVTVEDSLMSIAENRIRRGGKFCLTTDLWRALTIEVYFCLTVHYIDGDWSLKSRILDFCVFPPPHTGGAIAMKIMEFLRE